MKDPTTEGYEVSANEIDRMVRNLCAYALGEPEPLRRYLDLTHQQVLFEGMADALRRERGKALADLLIAGATAEEIVEQTNLTKPLDVSKLVRAAGQAEHVKQTLAAAANAERKAAAEAKKREAATKAAKPAKKRAALPDIPPGTRRVLTADELKALVAMPAAPKKRRSSASED
jgi:hypothetical protein